MPTAVRILVAIANPATEDALVRLAATLAATTDGELHLAHVVPSNVQDPTEERSGLERASRNAELAGSNSTPHLLRGDDVTALIGESAREWDCGMMVMGWRGDVDRDAVLSSVNSALAKSVDVDTLIFKDKGFKPAHRIVVPTGGGGHSLMGLQVAADLSRAWGAELCVIRVARDRECRPHDPILERYCSQVHTDTELRLKLLGIEADVEVVPAVDVVAPIVSRIREDDFLVLGASNDWRQEEFLAGSIPDEIAYEAPCSLLMVRAKPSPIRLNNIFFENTVRLNLAPSDKWDAISQMVDVLVDERQIPASQRQPVLDAALQRERQSSTAMGRETAIPHAPIENLPGIIGALAMCPDGVDFESQTGELVRFIFLLLTPQENYRGYIPILGQIANLMHSDESRADFMHCRTPSELTALIKNGEPD